jgi:DnaJ-like protein/PilZ domain-containing protein
LTQPKNEISLGAAQLEYTPDQITAYYWELEQVLERVEGARTYYEALDVDRLASNEEVRLAYLRAVALLNPAQIGIKLAIDDIAMPRIDPAFETVSRAYSVLVNFSRRAQYDETLLENPNLHARIQSAKKAARSTAPARTRRSATAERSFRKEEVRRDEPGLSQEVPAVQPAPRRVDNRRAAERFKLLIPVHVTGYDRRGVRWNEVTRTIDVSRTGAMISMRKRVQQGTVLYITLPLPVKLRSRDYSERSYTSYALVRRVDVPREGYRTVGLEFLGEVPPPGFVEKPWGRFQTKKWTGVERRRHPRQERSEVVLIEYYTEAMQCIKQETASTENLSSGGMRVSVKSVPADFELVRISCSSKGFTSLAAVTNQYQGKDGKQRLCLRFLDNEWTD